MILPRPQDAIHRAWLYRLLTGILDDSAIARQIYFKGGTCASMLGYLDRFSVDLDFDLGAGSDSQQIRQKLQDIFKELALGVKNESQKVLQFFLHYEAPAGQRNTIKLDMLPPAAKANEYEAKYLPDIDRYARCQTLSTMVANKLIAPLDRYEKNRSIAARDLYDLHYFLTHGYRYREQIIIERRHQPARAYLKDLREFIDKRITTKIINEDLNTLLPRPVFARLRRTIKAETLLLLKDEISRAKD